MSEPQLFIDGKWSLRSDRHYKFMDGLMYGSKKLMENNFHENFLAMAPFTNCNLPPIYFCITKARNKGLLFLIKKDAMWKEKVSEYCLETCITMLLRYMGVKSPIENERENVDSVIKTIITGENFHHKDAWNEAVHYFETISILKVNGFFGKTPEIEG
jgi:hypothetical protein